MSKKRKRKKKSDREPEELSEMVEFLFKNGLLAWKAGDYEMVEKIFSRILEYEPQNAAAWYIRG